MNRLFQYFRRSELSEKQWSELTHEEQRTALDSVKRRLSETMDPLCGVTFCCFRVPIPELQTIILWISIDAFDLCLREMTPRPYVLMPQMEENTFHALFVQNLERVTALMAPSPHLARIAVREALTTGGVCGVSLEPLSSFQTHYVGICGHVFSVAVAGLDRCPTCREPVAWTSVPILPDES